METSRESIIMATIKGVRRYGLDVRVRQISELSTTSPGNIYAYFPGKEDLLNACFERVDRQIAHIFDHVQLDLEQLADDPETEIRRLWTPYFRWLVAHPDETIFYHYFRNHPGFPAYDLTRDVSYFQSFMAIVTAIDAHFHIYEQMAYNILWLHVLTGTVMYAKYVVEGVLPADEATEAAIFRLTMYGLSGLMTGQLQSCGKGGEQT